MLTDVEREHLFLLGLGRPPGGPLPRGRGRHAATATRARRAGAQPGLREDPDWDVVAWNRAAAAVLTDYAALPRRATQHPAPRSSAIRASAPRRSIGRASRASWWRRSAPTWRAPARRRTSKHWSTSSAGSAPSSRRCGATTTSAAYGEGTKHLRHPVAGPIALEYSAFAVDGRPDLSMVIYNPATPADADRIRSLVKPQTSASIERKRPRKKQCPAARYSRS